MTVTGAMAANTTEVLEPGTMVKCKTCYGIEICGEVAAFDLNKKALILVSPPAQGSSQTQSTVHMLNLNNLLELEVEKEPSAEKEAPLPSLDNAKLSQRVRNTVREKMKKVESIGIGVTPEAQSLFHAIKKTIEDTRWDGKTIVVLNDVRISEPYKVEDLQTIPGRNEKSLNHVTKLVQKYYEDKKKPAS